MNTAEEKTVTPLMPVENINAMDYFGKDSRNLDHLLSLVEKDAKALVPDLSTDVGRKEVASNAYKVARSKTAIDAAGKDLVADIKAQAKVIDERRKHAREFLDRVRDEVRLPLTEWEAEEAKKEEAARVAAEMELDHMEALRENELFDREAEVRLQQAEIKALQDAQAKREAEAAQRERDERLQREAEERGREQQAAVLEREKQARIQADQRAQHAEETERLKAAATIEAAELARKEAEAQKRLDEEARAADKANRDKVHGAIVDALVADGVGKQTADKVLRLLVSGGVPNVAVKY